MRRIQQRQIEELTKQIEEAHSHIRQNIEQGSMRAALTLLEECQNCGIAIGTVIEHTEGEGHPTVSLLEKYCELIYRIYRDLADGEEVDAGRIYKMLKQESVKLENSLRHDVTVRTEAVFLPYQASMWDSMESVWRAADADPNCDAYVVPIPYYDKNADGSFGAIHYDGSRYPSDVAITDYRKYDFSKRRPDVVFIHNPYDQYNLVTSVAPFYYAKNLKQYTDRLVYIPYFVLREILPEDAEAVKRMEHFVTVPGVFYADQVIVQSENMRTVYIDVLAETFGGQTKQVWENKILGLGSPKTDKLANTDRENMEIPEEWRRIIQKLDGRRKKLVLYNTGINSLLKHEEKMLRKIRNTLDIFRKNQNEAALLWRPHPLIKATIASMRPALWNAYQEIVEQYRSEGWGIYDDTADLDRAVVLSDAYYGDWSSVAFLYQETGKLVMVKNVKLLSGENEAADISLLCKDENAAEERSAYFHACQADKIVTQEDKTHDIRALLCYLVSDACQISGCESSTENGLHIWKEIMGIKQ